jgi:3-oxoacyl-[acyl-carrier-protein] synthase-3
LGLSKNVAAFDINHGCSGYVYCLALAKSMIATLGIKNMLIITGTHASSYIHPRDVAVRLLFGDASSATLVRAGDRETIGEFVLGTDGGGFKKMIVRDGWDANPFSEESFKERQDQFGNVYTDSCIHMDGPGTFLFIIKHVPRIIEETLAKNNLTKDDIDLYVLHQANYMALEKVREKLGINAERFFYNMDTVGNTVQSTIPIALKDARQAGKIGPGSVVLIAGFGIGISWGATVIRF